MPTKILPILLMTMTAFVTGCSGSGDANDVAASRPNSFPGKSNPASGFSEKSPGDSTNTSGLRNDNEVRVTVEVPASLAPDGALSRRNLHLVQPDSVRVYRSNEDLAEVASVDTNIRTDDEGFKVIEFPGGQPLGPDVLIEVTVNGTRMRAYATDFDRDIKINPFSEYIVRHGLGDYTSDEFAAVMDCVNGTGQICINKFVWSTLADQAQNFEISIPSGISFEGAVAFVGNRADFTRYVDDMADLALVPPDSSEQIEARSLGLNSVFFGIELGRSSLASSDDSHPGQWGTRNGVAKVVESNGTATIYPGATLASFNVFGINASFIAANSPYERYTLVQFDSNTYQALSPDAWEINSHTTTSNPASIKNGNELVSGQALLQTITGKTRPRTIGWTRNPFVRDAYLDGDSGEVHGLISSYFSGGKAIELGGSDGDYERLAELEETFTSVFDIDLPQSENFSVDTLSPTYNIMSFSVQLGVEEKPFRAESVVGTWSGSGGQYTQTATAAELSRSSGGTVTPSVGEVRNGPRVVSNRTSMRSTADVNDGRLNLDASSETTDDQQKPSLGIGASNPDGSLIAFNLSNGTNGEGVLIGIPDSNGAEPTLANYRMQGTVIDLTLDSNRLRQIINGALSITEPGKATANFSGLDVLQTVSSETLQPPRTLQSADIDMTYTTTTDGVITFTAGTLELTGFVSPDSEYMLLQVRDTQASGQQSLGLVLAVREDR